MAVEIKQGLREQLIFDAVEYKLSEPLDSKRTLCLLGEKKCFSQKRVETTILNKLTSANYEIMNSNKNVNLYTKSQR